MYYTDSHEWLEMKGNIGTVGITSHAQKELGEVVFVELPQVGAEIRAKEEVCVIESTKAAADIYSPVSGKVCEVNEAIQKNPSMINHSSEKEGWLFKIELSDLTELHSLMDESGYSSLIH